MKNYLQQNHLFSYCLNNAVNDVDQSGEFGIFKWISFSVNTNKETSVSNYYFFFTTEHGAGTNMSSNNNTKDIHISLNHPESISKFS